MRYLRIWLPEPYKIKFTNSNERYLCKSDQIQPQDALIWMVKRNGSALKESSKKFSAHDWLTCTKPIKKICTSKSYAYHFQLFHILVGFPNNGTNASMSILKVHSSISLFRENEYLSIMTSNKSLHEDELSSKYVQSQD